MFPPAPENEAIRVKKAPFPPALGNPANRAGVPLTHCSTTTIAQLEEPKLDISVLEKRTFNW